MKREESFWSRVDVRSDDECWEWQGAITAVGYAKLPFAWEGRIASRYSYYLNIDENFNRNLFVCHRCDNPICVNPKHLFLGTQKDNMQDMQAKGRSAQAKKTHCPQGHEYRPENLCKRRDNRRQCKICKRESDLRNQMKYYYKNHEKSKAMLRQRYARKKVKLENSSC
jgi:hypothetical protein